MLKLTRRRLIQQASIGAGAVSMLAATVATKTHMKSSSAIKAQAAETSVLTPGEALVIYVTDSATGTLTILRGEQATTVHNVALVQHLLSL